MWDGSGNLVNEILLSSVLSIFIFTGVVGVALGLGLNISSERTLRFLKTLNHWTSARKSLKPVEIPRDIDKAIYRQRRWFGAAFALGGGFTIFMLMFEVEFPYVVAALSRNTAPVIVEVLVESLKWFLVLGSILAVAIGVTMLASTCALPALEAHFNRWFSTRKFSKGASQMRMTLDNWVEAFPRTAGVMLVIGSMIVLIAAMIVWIGDWHF
jgi:hypothetical protein